MILLAIAATCLTLAAVLAAGRRHPDRLTILGVVLAVAAITTAAWYPNRERAKLEERTAIHHEEPAHNVVRPQMDRR